MVTSFTGQRDRNHSHVYVHGIASSCHREFQVQIRCSAFAGGDGCGSLSSDGAVLGQRSNTLPSTVFARLLKDGEHDPRSTIERTLREFRLLSDCSSATYSRIAEFYPGRHRNRNSRASEHEFCERDAGSFVDRGRFRFRTHRRAASFSVLTLHISDLTHIPR